MGLFSNLSERFRRKQHQTNSNSGKPFDEIYKDLGGFEYNTEGFKISYEDFIKELKWAEITQLDVYKTDLMIYDQIEMEIIYGDKFFTISEELPGWYQFVEKTKKIFPNIPKDWDTKIIHPSFATNLMTIYTKVNP
ncbi:MAG TPA: hypothetical protein VK489_07820 [Ferruginibacter sp.]|nr:hypothetical protein [Ferruginibacter sp.]